MKKLTKYSAYHGGSWHYRTSSHRAESKQGRLWEPNGVDSEFGQLKKILLCRPLPPPKKNRQPEKIQHLRKVHWPSLNRELQLYARKLKKHGIQVHWLESDSFLDPKPNLMFVRDPVFMTPWGAVLGRMASPVRAGEEKWAQLALAQAGVPLLSMIRGRGLLEGADALWVSPQTVFVGVGNRTNREGFVQLQNLLREFQVETVAIEMPKSVQHLLGLLQIIDKKRALVRTDVASPKLTWHLNKLGFEILDVAETAEVVHRQAMNLLTLAPGRVIIAQNCPDFKKYLAQHHIRVVDEVAVDQLLNAAGGLACASLPLQRGTPAYQRKRRGRS